MAILTDPHWEALTPALQTAFERVAQIQFIPEYYLAGGTGLGLHLGHRFSIDLDLFSPNPHAVGPDERASLRQTFDDPTLEVTYDKDSTFVVVWRGVGVSFFRLNLYPLVQTPFLVNGVPLATIEEIGAMKLAATISRGSRKDLVDLYFILQRISLEAIFEVASKKYAQVRNFPASAIRGLAYFEDAEAQPMPRMIDKTPWSKMKRFLERQAIEAGRQKLDALWE
jgi:predicted nucleotidyltransferase component of viral defense system